MRPVTLDREPMEEGRREGVLKAELGAVFFVPIFSTFELFWELTVTMVMTARTEAGAGALGPIRPQPRGGMEGGTPLCRKGQLTPLSAAAARLLLC